MLYFFCLVKEYKYWQQSNIVLNLSNIVLLSANQIADIFFCLSDNQHFQDILTHMQALLKNI